MSHPYVFTLMLLPQFSTPLQRPTAQKNFKLLYEILRHSFVLKMDK